MKCKKLIAAALAAVFGMLLFAESVEPEMDLQHDFVVIGAEHPYDLNPYTANYSSEAQVLSGLFEGLYSYDPKTLDPVPAIAVDFKISRNKKRWTFTIRENVKFSNGDPLNAYSVRDSWLTLLATPDAPYASLLDSISGAKKFRHGQVRSEEVGIVARDEKTLVVTLDTPMAHLQRILCHHAFSVVSSKDGVYSGAFVLKSSENNTLLLEKNPNYWDAEHVYLPSITVQSSSDLKENAWKFNTGRADWVSGMVDTAAVLNKNAIRIAAEFGTEYLFFSCKNTPWDNADLRNALLAAVPWEELRKNSLVQATTLVYPLAGYPTVEGLTDTSVEEAKDMMAIARKTAGIPENKTLTLIFGITGSDRMKREAELLQEAWKPLGVDLKVQTTPEDRYLLSIQNWNADLFSYSWIGDFADPLAFLELFRDGSTLNQSKWKNTFFNQLLKDAAETNSSAEHNKLLSQAEQVLLDDGIVLPISHSVCLHAVSPTAVGGWYTNALDIHPFKYLYFKTETSTVPNVVMR